MRTNNPKEFLKLLNKNDKIRDSYKISIDSLFDFFKDLNTNTSDRDAYININIIDVDRFVFLKFCLAFLQSPLHHCLRDLRRTIKTCKHNIIPTDAPLIQLTFPNLYLPLRTMSHTICAAK
jgi:hypothetical protein